MTKKVVIKLGKICPLGASLRLAPELAKIKVELHLPSGLETGVHVTGALCVETDRCHCALK